MAEIIVKGMTCPHCVASVTKALEEIEGLEEVRVDLATGRASYTEREPVESATVKEAIVKIGFVVVD